MTLDLQTLTALLRRCNAHRRARAGLGPAAPAPTGAEQDALRGFRPERRLAVYGSLLPGAANHAEVAPLGGSWTPVTVHGHLAERAWPVFTWDALGPPVAMQVLEAPGLAAAWPRLDAFEGPDYLRILVPVLRRDAMPGVANLYEAVDPVVPA